MNVNPNEKDKEKDENKSTQSSGFAFEEATMASLGFDPNKASKIENFEDLKRK